MIKKFAKRIVISSLQFALYLQYAHAQHKEVKLNQLAKALAKRYAQCDDPLSIALCALQSRNAYRELAFLRQDMVQMSMEMTILQDMKQIDIDFRRLDALAVKQIEAAFEEAIAASRGDTFDINFNAHMSYPT